MTVNAKAAIKLAESAKSLVSEIIETDKVVLRDLELQDPLPLDGGSGKTEFDLKKEKVEDLYNIRIQLQESINKLRKH